MGIRTKSTKSVATWQRWEKSALDRKFMIVMSILGLLSLGTIIAIIGTTHKVLTDRPKPPETGSMIEGRNPAQVATATLKVDGSLFSGRVVRRENNSITMEGPGGLSAPSWKATFPTSNMRLPTARRIHPELPAREPPPER
jgi:hypothetical protein